MKDSKEYKQLMLIINSSQLRGFSLKQIAAVIRD
jgi:hypothetical protein